jgi:uncharacterized Ntn-hydrolase superfamily protein
MTITAKDKDNMTTREALEYARDNVRDNPEAVLAALKEAHTAGGDSELLNEALLKVAAILEADKDDREGLTDDALDWLDEAIEGLEDEDEEA